MGIYEGLQMKVTPAGVITNKDGTVSFVIFGEDGEVLYCKTRNNLKKLWRQRINELLYYQRFDMAFSVLFFCNSSIASVTGRQQEVL